MSKKITTKKISSKKVMAIKKPKFKLITYTMKAVIPTGQYANIQPEITVQADTIEHAERAVMPYIETLFARFRDGGVKTIEQTTIRPVVSQPTNAPVNLVPKPKEVPASNLTNIVTPVSTSASSSTTAVAPAIVLTVPFNRAKSALESCTSLAALKLVTDQIEKSTKLVDAEKVDLRKISEAKLEKLNGTKTA